MAHPRRVVRCHSCGAILQSESTKKPGFISKNIVENGIPKIPYCNSCYEKMLTLNSGDLEQEVDKATLKILKDAVATDALIIWVVDLFSFNGTLNPDVVKKVKKLDVIVFGTKRDLFPSNVTDEMLVRYIDERFSDIGITPIYIQLTGNESGLWLRRGSGLRLRRWGADGTAADVAETGSFGIDVAVRADGRLRNRYSANVAEAGTFRDIMTIGTFHG